MLWHWSRHTLPVSVRGAGLFFCCGFCCCGSVVFRVAFFSELALYGRILLYFRTPKEGYSACICVIRSTSTTRCDDLAEATGAQDGKKKLATEGAPPWGSVSGCQSQPSKWLCLNACFSPGSQASCWALRFGAMAPAPRSKRKTNRLSV